MNHKNIYTDAQKSAIMHGDGPAAVFAGPGSGKTFVITERIFYMIYTLGIKPEHILVITFTKAAAKQMNARFYKKSKENLPITFKTFHAFFYHILSQSKMYMNKKIISDKEKIQILRQIIYLYFPNESDQSELMKEISAYLGNRYTSTKSNEYIYFNENEREQILTYYEEEKNKLNRMDFTDLVYLCLGKLKHDSEFLDLIQKQYLYILIDEFQDITPLQYEIIRLISTRSNNIFIVGDEDHSIYKFCGSKSNCMRKFVDDYFDTKKIFLDVNFRSRKEIIDCSKKLIEHNQDRIRYSTKAYCEEMGNVETIKFESKIDEYNFIAEQILLCSTNMNELAHIEIAIISRTKINWNQIIFQLKKHGITLANISINPKLMQSEYILDILAYLNFAKNGNARQDLVRILNKPMRYINSKMFRDEKISFEKLKQEFQGKERIIQEVNRIEKQMRFISCMSLHGSIHFIRNGIGYDKYAIEHMMEKHENHVELINELNLLEDIAKKCKTLEDLFSYTESNFMKKKDSDTFLDGEKNISVNLTTMHASKGLEYDMVFIIDVNENNIPHKRATTLENLEEERRLLYVAITRARKALFLSYVESEKDLKSRYIEECIGI